MIIQNLLILSALLITAGIVAFASFVNAVRVGFGRKRPGWPIVVAAFGLWLLHAGYLLAPWLWREGRTTLGLWLILPVAFLALLLWLFLAQRFLLAPPSPNRDKRVRLLWALGLLSGLFAYGAVPVIFLNAGETWLHELAASPTFARIVAILANAIGPIVTLGMIGLMFAGMPNSSPAQLRFIQRLMLGTFALGLACLAGGVWLFVAGRPWPAALVGGLPIVSIFITMYAASRTRP